MSGSWRHGEVFDAIAETYDARRSGYPRELVSAAVEIAGLGPGSHVVEVGAGTGKLTEELVAFGLHVDAVDPGRNMVAVARRRLEQPDLVRFHIGRFEEVSLPEGRFDAVFSAAAFHWVDPDRSWAKAAALLRPGGTIALLHLISLREDGDGGMPEELAAAFTRLAPELAGWRSAPRDAATVRRGAEQRRTNVSEVWAWLTHPGLAVPEAASLFGPASLTSVPRVTEQTAAELWAVFETTSRFHRLPTSAREALRLESDRIVDRHGGAVRSTQLVVLVTAHRR